MWFEFSHPWALALLPVCAAVVFAAARRHPCASPQARLSHALRYVMITLTVLSMAGLSVLGGSTQKNAWILLDASDSMSAVRQEAEEMVRDALHSNGSEQNVGVIAFGRDAMVEIPLSQSPDFHGVETAVDASASSLDQALALACALLPSDASGGVAVISDGKLDEADSAELQNRGISVNSLELSRAAQADAQLTSLETPPTAYLGQRLSVTVTVHATQDSDASIVLHANQTPVATRDVQLRKGENSFVFQHIAAQTGVTAYEAQVLMPGDGTPQNDRAGAFVTVSGAPSVLIAEGQTGAGSELSKLLTAAGMQTEVIAAAALTQDTARLRAYQGVALVNVDADSLSDEQIQALDTGVREFGVGAAVFGGDSSYALGSYRGSALEEMLPVTIDVRNQADMPSTALVLVIDKSSSMTDGQYGVTRLDVAKEAACRSVEVLTAQDQVGVIAFDDAGKWVVPLSYAEDAAAIQEQIGTIRPGGGTAFYTPLAMAYSALEAASARHKHIIFLTDGQSADGGYEALAEAMAQKGITLTTVAVGNGADTQSMQRLAQLGGGRAYAAGEFDNVPKIFTKETMLVAGSYVQNRTFTPVVTDASLTDYAGFPALDGYLTTAEKPLATVSLASDRGDPILCWWQYGAGRVLCWTSDIQGAWSGRFLAWDEAVSFFGGMVAHVLPQREQEGEMNVQNGTLSYTAPFASEEAQVEARVLFPDGTLETLFLEQTAATRFEAPIDTAQVGAYAVEVEMKQGDTLVAALDGGTVVSYSQEYDLQNQQTGALEKLSGETGGASVETAAELLTFPLSKAQSRYSLQTPLLLTVLILLLADIAQMRLHWPKASRPKEERSTPAPRAARVKPAKPSRQAEAGANPAATSEKLWQNLQKKQRM